MNCFLTNEEVSTHGGKFTTVRAQAINKFTLDLLTALKSVSTSGRVAYMSSTSRHAESENDNVGS